LKFGLLALSALALLGCGRGQDVTTPRGELVFTSTLEVTDIEVDKDGNLFVGTMGGVLRRDTQGKWEVRALAWGLPSNEVLMLYGINGVAHAQFPNQHHFAWRNGKWEAAEQAESWRAREHMWKKATSFEKAIDLGWKGKFMAPKHPFSNMELWDSRLWISARTDGVFWSDGGAWTPLEDGPKDVTAIFGSKEGLWIGTRRQGLFLFDGKETRHVPMISSPVNLNVQSLAAYKGSLFASTLEDGLVVLTPQGWAHLEGPTISSLAPRQMVEFKGKLYVRHGEGQIDTFDGKDWVKNALHSTLPRKASTALWADKNKLYVAQAGGWSEFDGQRWEHTFKPELSGAALTAVLADGPRTWLGTQGRGVLEVGSSVLPHDERGGLPDDWITAIESDGKMIYAGSFVAGLSAWDGSRWTDVAGVNAANVTALVPLEDRMLVGTREGLFQVKDGKGSRVEMLYKDHEIQALLKVDGGLWVGTRTGLYHFTDERLFGS
jgi:ligand-binding sensor domain-containing protein